MIPLEKIDDSELYRDLKNFHMIMNVRAAGSMHVDSAFPAGDKENLRKMFISSSFITAFNSKSEDVMRCL
jgi:hypothetical protein